ncbi:adenylosuccinate lyase [Ichthyenterobacterium sp. W332]|uniref:Adenylosuccinate lyase n=1 Tax=Microcosmobacter mediterraneus TaxID=3075607 RepID=A0ABU2YJ28_9FLAO|nr:adenylosuccinate lyase [Ichthyenterobacterium sp. W332]MDT0557684.1 adenylosuccinate lyase [Ichthyenterobacterium sp. W332]
MTTEELYKELSYVNHSRDNRKRYADLVINNPDLLPKVLDILLRVDDKHSARAAWLLEFVARENLHAILPLTERLLSEMHRVHLDPAVRPMAKICEYLIEAYYKDDETVKNVLTAKMKDQIIENCFDWMINDEKIAPKAYSMNSLYLLGQDYDWIHPELVLILERDFQMQSSGFKARARHILKKIKKN